MKGLHYLNLVGVLAVAVLCVVQWRVNRQLNLEVMRLDRLRQDQQGRIIEQERATRDRSEDLEGFRSQYQRANTDAQEAVRQLTVVEQKVIQLQRERDQLRQSVTNWAAALAERDQKHAREVAQLRQSVTNWAEALAPREARIQEANARLQELGAELSARTTRLNDLTLRYNTAVGRLNEMTSNYNAVVKQLNEVRGSR